MLLNLTVLNLSQYKHFWLVLFFSLHCFYFILFYLFYFMQVTCLHDVVEIISVILCSFS